jgi:hypothetical protein
MQEPSFDGRVDLLRLWADLRSVPSLSRTKASRAIPVDVFDFLLLAGRTRFVPWVHAGLPAAGWADRKRNTGVILVQRTS